MSSTSLVHPTNEAFADIKEEIVAEEAADPAKKKLGVLFWLCVGWIILVALAATFASLLPLPNPTLGNYNSVQNAGPGWGHLLGTDDLYRDIFSRLVFGARVSLVVGFGGALIGLVVGGIPAMISAYRRGRIDTALEHRLLHRAGVPGHRGRDCDRVVLGQVLVQDHADHRAVRRAA